MPSAVATDGRSLRTVIVLMSGPGLDQQARGLDVLREQALDLAGERDRRCLGLLGERVVAGTALGEGDEHLLVVAEADPDRGGGDAVGARVGGELLERRRIRDAGVGLAVGEQHDRGAGLPRRALGLLQRAQVARGQVGVAAGLDRVDRGLRRRLAVLGERAGRQHDLGGRVEGDDAEAVLRVEPLDERDQRLLRREQSRPGHRAGAVEHDHDGVRRARGVGGRRGRGLQLEQHADDVVLLQSDDIDVEVGVHVHGGLLPFGGSDTRVLWGSDSPAMRLSCQLTVSTGQVRVST